MYKASNVTLNAETLEARSYDWWVFAKFINGKLVFNNYGYSNTTRRHQSKVLNLIVNKLLVKIDYFIEAPKGLQRLESAIDHYEREIKGLTELINKKGTRKSKNAERAEKISFYQDKIKLCQDLIKNEA